MNRTDALYQSFLEILREELVPAMGCTEPSSASGPSVCALRAAVI